MGWKAPLLGLLLLASFAALSSALETQSPGSDHAPDSHSTPIHHPSASLSIAGNLKDLNLKSSIAQLLRALQVPHSSVQPVDPERKAKLELDGKKPQILTKHGLLSPSSEGGQGGRKLFTGQEEKEDPSGLHLPQSITISSQPIQIGSGSGGLSKNKTIKKKKGGRSLITNVDALTGVRTIEGIRVPDDEHDKHHTWRNARVIKGFLVPNDRAPNPHAKRQVQSSGNGGYLANGQHTNGGGYELSSLGQPVGVGGGGQQFSYSSIFQDQSASIQPGQFYSRTQSDTSSSSQDSQANIQATIAQAQAAVQALQQQQQQQQQHHHQRSPQEGGGQTQVYQSSQGQQTFSQRIQNQGSQQQGQSAFVIQPQTYVTGPGGVSYTLPIPVPADQVQSQQQQQPHPQQRAQAELYAQQYQQYLAQFNQHQQEQGHQVIHPSAQQGQRPHIQRPSHSYHHNPPNANFATRVMAALQSNSKTLERMDTATAVVPALASTGIFLGLSALAAGWYLSKGNREVGIVRRSGKPAAAASGGSSSPTASTNLRFKRDAGQASMIVPGQGPFGGQTNNNGQEVDQATFFQSIIQQSLEKSQQQYEDQEPIIYQGNQERQESQQSYQQNQEAYHEQRRPSKARRPQRREDYDDEREEYNNNLPQKKSGHGGAVEKSSAPLTVGSSKNFAKVFIPAMILGLSVIAITGLIFGWYITGANREIAFLEPQAYQGHGQGHVRRKRSFDLSDGWLQQTLKAIHGNPPTPTSQSMFPHPFLQSETSKTHSTEFAISNAGFTGVLAGGAIIALVAFGLVNSFGGGGEANAARKNPLHLRMNMNNMNNMNNNNNNAAGGGKNGAGANGANGGNRLARNVYDNGLEEVNGVNDPGFLAGVLRNIEESAILREVGEAAGGPCAKRMLCDLILGQGDDTINAVQKRIHTFLPLMPESVNKNLSQVLSSVYKRDCSDFKCKRFNPPSSRLLRNVHARSSPSAPNKR